MYHVTYQMKATFIVIWTEENFTNFFFPFSDMYHVTYQMKSNFIVNWTEKENFTYLPLGGLMKVPHLVIRLLTSRPPSSSTASRVGSPGRTSRIEFRLDIPGTGGQSWSSRRYLVRADLKLHRVGLLRMTLGILFQSLAPVILNDASNLLWALELQDLVRGGILQHGPRLSESVNTSCRSLGVRPLNIL